MKRVVTLTALMLVGIAPGVSEGFGRRGGCREYSCAAPCAVAAAEVKYEERKITYMKPVWKEKEVEAVVVRCVPRQEKFVYEVNVPVTTHEKRMAKVARTEMKEETYMRKVAEPVRSVEKRKVVVNRPVFSDVEYDYTVMVPSYRDVKRTVPTCTWETRMVEATVPVCRVVPVTCTDACGRCYTVCRTVTEYQKVQRCVRVPVHGTREVVVKECHYTPEKRKGVKRVCNYQATETWVDVPVCTWTYKDVPCKRMVCNTVWEDREVTVPVCRVEKQKREGVRTVIDRVEEKVKTKVRYCDYEQVTEVVRVAVGGACAAPACGDCGRVGLFARFRRCD